MACHRGYSSLSLSFFFLRQVSLFKPLLSFIFSYATVWTGHDTHCYSEFWPAATVCHSCSVDYVRTPVAFLNMLTLLIHWLSLRIWYPRILIDELLQWYIHALVDLSVIPKNTNNELPEVMLARRKIWQEKANGTIGPSAPGRCRRESCELRGCTHGTMDADLSRGQHLSSWCRRCEYANSLDRVRVMVCKAGSGTHSTYQMQRRTYVARGRRI